MRAHNEKHRKNFHGLRANLTSSLANPIMETSAEKRQSVSNFEQLFNNIVL